MLYFYLFSLFLFVFTDVISAIRVTEVSGILEEICEFIYACRTMRMSTGCWDLSASIIWHDIGKWMAWVGHCDYIRTWPWKIVCHKFAGLDPEVVEGALHANKSRPVGSSHQKNSIKQTNVSSDKYSKWLIHQWIYK